MGSKGSNSDVRLFSPSEAPSLASFDTLCSQTATKSQYPLADAISHNIPIYNLLPFASLTSAQRTALQDEWYRVLLSGPGVFVTKCLYSPTLLNKVNAVFKSIIAAEKEQGASGDHFAGAGKNDRIWNSFSKHALADPASFLEYYANPYLAVICEAWLGAGYRITAQVNNVKPGAGPQVSHRDYHLGFMSAAQCARVPRAMHVASQFLTLQGAVAHVPVPLESGPTRLLPFSQAFEEGYMAYRREEFAQYFLEKHVSLPLDAGDGLFFNPALFHAAGANQSADIQRMANLLQVSSPLGKPMETISSRPLVASVWSHLTALHEKHGESDEVQAFLAALGEGYAFPTNLDRNQPQGADAAPESEQDVLWRCLRGRKSTEDTLSALDTYAAAARP